MPRTKQQPLYTGTKYLKLASLTPEERKRQEAVRFRRELRPIVDGVGVLATTHEDGDLTFLYVPLTHASWARVKEHLAALKPNLGEHINFFNALDDYIGSHGCFEEDDEVMTAVRMTLVGSDERAAWTKAQAWTCHKPHFTNSEMIFMPSWS